MDDRTDAVMGGHGHLCVTGGPLPFYVVSHLIVERLAALKDPDVSGRLNVGHLMNDSVVELVRGTLEEAQAQGLIP